MSHYQGHLADGSSVQKHSAGGLYPYVIYAKQQGDALRWGYIAPDGREHLVADSYGGACDSAMAHRDNVARLKAFAAGRAYALLACRVEVPPLNMPLSQLNEGLGRSDGDYTEADNIRVRRMADEMRRYPSRG